MRVLCLSVAIVLFVVTTGVAATGIAEWQKCGTSQGVFADVCSSGTHHSSLVIAAFLLLFILGAVLLVTAIVLTQRAVRVQATESA